jgi:hypothetical protein
MNAIHDLEKPIALMCLYDYIDGTNRRYRSSCLERAGPSDQFVISRARGNYPSKEYTTKQVASHQK